MYFFEVAIVMFIGAFAMTYILVPKIIHIVAHKRLMDDPDHRSSHAVKTPTLGGVAFYFVMIIALFFLRYFSENEDEMFLIPGLTILFFIGLKDDLVVLGPGTKFLAQIVAISFVLMNDTFTITSLHGFLGIETVSYYFYVFVAGFMMLTIINSYNLIDGIDGLASLVGIVIMIIYTTIFFLAGEHFFALLAIIMNGILMAFLGFNLSSHKKIFMGDTGSLLIGFMISVLTLKFLALTPDTYDQIPFLLENAPLVAIGILIIPLFDTARVVAIRLMNKKGPFSPDRNHMHHVLIDYWGLSHKKASFLIGGFNLVFIILFIVIGSRAQSIGLISVLVFAVVGLGLLLFKYNYSTGALRKKISWKRKLKSMFNKGENTEQ